MKLLKWILLVLVLFAFTNGQESDAIDGNDKTVPEQISSAGTLENQQLGETQQDQAPSGETFPENVFAPISEEKMADLLKEFNKKSVAVCHRSVSAGWAVATDVGNKEKELEKVNAAKASAKFHKEWFNKYWKDANLSDYKNEEISRQLYFLKDLGSGVLPPERLADLSRIVTNMSATYNKATICPYGKEDCGNSDSGRLSLEPEITERMADSRNFDELKYIWTAWHDASGKHMRNDYIEYVKLINEVAIGNNYRDGAEYWKSNFEDPNFEEKIDTLWLQIKPLYDALHTYMRYKLIEIYGDKIERNAENLPAHIFGNMWAQSWTNLYDDTKPFSNASNIDITSKMKELKWDAVKMFETSNEFYMSLGLPSNKMSYTGDSIILKPTNRTIQCHASAWDFCDGKDFRIKMCTSVNSEHLVTIHHEMGHIQYYIQYKNLPTPFRKGANPGFHEAVGDTIALSVSNPKHLVKIGLLEKYDATKEDNINALYLEALKRIAFLPFGLLIDKWRWDVFSGKVNQDEWNKHWWELRSKYQKVAPPVKRSELDFDPGAKYHIPGSSAYISYFVAHILEFSFYKSLCIEANEYNPNNATDTPHNPLDRCDFYQSKKAGKKLADGLKMGGSKHWSEALKTLTGETEISADAILEYFKPLHDFLKVENDRLASEDQVRQIFEKYNKEAIIFANKVTIADWDKTTDLNNETKEEQYVEIVGENAKFTKDQYNLHFRNLSADNFTDEKIRRQLKKVTNLGTSILDESRLRQFTETVNEMVKIYNNATFCSYFKPNCTNKERLTLDPEITEVMANSTNYLELEHTWTMWHNSTGPLIRSHYKTYIDIYNEAAKLNGFNDAGEMWRDSFEDPNLVENMKGIWNELEPLYNELHQYVKNKLALIYDEVDANGDTIPAHLLGNMWAQTWDNLYERLKPFNASNLDITEALKSHNYTALKIFQESDRFYKSLGLESNGMSYTGKSIIEKPDPNDRLIVCHASAWDFYDGKDFRIKMCTTVNQENFITVHHEMGHIQYFILYKDQPLLFRDGANPGFHEAVGDLMALSVSNPNHLKKIDLLGDYQDTAEDNINALFKMALERVAFLPFGLLIDLYRYDLFSGKVKEKNWNKHWEDLRKMYQKVHSPVPRNESHFDAGAKFHVAGDSQYISYFYAYILEFQMYKSLCTAAGQYEPNNTAKPLHKCDLEGSQIAGKRLRNGLSLGASKHWSEALKLITNGEQKPSADAILVYFKPLYDFLVEENNKTRASKPLQGKMIYVVAGFGLLVAVVGAISFGIFHHNRK